MGWGQLEGKYLKNIGVKATFPVFFYKSVVISRFLRSNIVEGGESLRREQCPGKEDRSLKRPGSKKPQG